MARALSLAFTILALGACSGNTTAPPPAARTTRDAALPTPGSASGLLPPARAPSACPPAKKTSDACAAVMTYVKNPADGTCCAYGDPCSVPIAGQQYSDDKCTAPMGPATK